MQIRKVKTGSSFEESGSYSRAVAVGDMIFVSNTAGRNPATKEISGDISEQTRQVFANIETALAALDASLADVVVSRVFIQDPADTEAVMTVVGQTYRGIDPASTVTCPPLGSSIYKVEMEVTAYRGASAAPVEMIRI